ncbi:F-box/WD repeat-containing protein 5-like [Lineus longissimus]|uniref:F-box/WD repeat-containing protein 5-like n=1 Tax=Lineus longissimus TaxID=88925 RepID=UPI00315D57D2
MMESPSTRTPWQKLPDDILLKIFTYLQAQQLLVISQVCRSWSRVAYDELIWKDLFYRYWKIKRSIPMAPDKYSWREEFQRLYAHTPLLESEVIKQHTDQVLHVSFSHNGEMFATCSKDGFIKVWNMDYPVTIKYSKSLKNFTWKYTQFSQFNQSDTLLLVSGVHFGSFSTSGEIVVFSLKDGFELQCRVNNKPYDIFGTWYNDNYLLSGNLYWIGHLSSCSALWINKASQCLDSETESVVMRLLKFHNVNASTIRTIMVANCPKQIDAGQAAAMDSRPDVSAEKRLKRSPSLDPVENLIQYKEDYRLAEHLEESVEPINFDGSDDSNFCSEHYGINYSQISDDSPAGSSNPAVGAMWDFPSPAVNMDTKALPYTEPDSYGGTGNLDVGTSSSQILHSAKENTCDKYLIFTTGTLTYTPHLIGIKKMHMEVLQEADLKLNSDERLLPNVADNTHGLDREDDYNDVDHLIEMHGHIIGMCLSPDHRYLYVNSRPWPKNYTIEDPREPPPIAQEIDIHVIDLYTMKEVGTMHRSHKAYTPNDECFFIFLDVSDELVASGAEDKHGYMWDRHYGILLTKFEHKDVVNSVAFNPKDPEVLITASDDNTIKIWRSRNREAEVKKNVKTEPVCKAGTVETVVEYKWPVVDLGFKD